MPNYPEQYFNQDTPAKNYSDINKAVIKEIEVSGSSTDNIYIARLVKLTGTDTINLQTGDVNVKLDHTGTNFDSTRIGDGVDLWAINADGSGKISGSTIIYDSGGTSVNVVNNHLLTSGITSIQDVNISSGHLKTSGITSILNVSVSGNSLQTIITDSEATIGAVVGRSKKPQIKIIRPSNVTIYSILDSINSGGTVMERFRVARSNNKNSYVFAGHMTSSISASTALNCDLHLFSSGLTVSSDNTLWQANVNELDHHLGYINFSSWKVLGNRSVSEGVLENPFLLTTDPDNPDSVWGELVARNAYVPGSGEILTASLDISQD